MQKGQGAHGTGKDMTSPLYGCESVTPERDRAGGTEGREKEEAPPDEIPEHMPQTSPSCDCRAPPSEDP